MEEVLIEMHLAGVSVRRVEDITQAFWGTKVSPGTISNLNKRAYENIECWRNHKLPSKSYSYIYVDGIFLKRCSGEEFENVSILVAIGVSDDGYHEIISASESLKEDLESWKNFFVWLKQHDLAGVKLIVGDKALSIVEAIEKSNGPTKVVGTFQDGESAHMLVCVYLRHVTSSEWGTKHYLNMEHLASMILSEEENIIAG